MEVLPKERFMAKSSNSQRMQFKTCSNTNEESVDAMKKSGSTVLSLNQITSADYRDAGEVNLRFKQHVRESKRKSLFVSMNIQAIKSSIIQAACREKPSHAVQPRLVPRLLMLFRQQWNNINAAELLQTKRQKNCNKTKNAFKFSHFNVCLLLIFDICGRTAAGRILEGFHLNYIEDLWEVSFSEVGEVHHRRLEEWT